MELQKSVQMHDLFRFKNVKWPSQARPHPRNDGTSASLAEAVTSRAVTPITLEP
jgi:hypothetical protein